MTAGTDATIQRLFEDLTEPQIEAVQHTDGPLLILAGPGSGKTRVVTRRAAYLARTVAAPHQILAVTFTNKAAREMKERIAVLGVEPGMTVSTFHALCARLLRIYHEGAGVPRHFSIMDRDDRLKVLRRAIEACELSTTHFSPASVEPTISNAKNGLLDAAAFSRRNLDWRDETVARIYQRYEKAMTAMDALDFDDLLMRVAVMLQSHESIRAELEDRFRYVLIDEYQDTNAAQYLIGRLLTRERHNVCATGDPDQSIYGWRGANIENILTFERDYPDARVVRLEQNYRSTGRILAAADALITGNIRRKEKALWTANEEGPAVNIIECESGEEEAEAVAAAIGERLREGTDPAQIAVFYRTNSLSRVLEEALIRAGLRYQVARGVEFYNRKEIKDVLAYLRVLVNPADEVALRRIINTPPRGIGATTIQRLVDRAAADRRSLFDVIIAPEALEKLGRSAAKVAEFGELLVGLRGALELPAAQALEYVMTHTGLRAFHGSANAGGEAPKANLDELISAASVFQRDNPDATILDWLEYAALVSDVDSVESDGGAVTLMTLHAAKGLEFDVVFIVGLEEGLLPFRKSEEDTVDEEEERRLCFVGMTRARRRLTLSRARYRMMRGANRRTVRSPFLNELSSVEVQQVKLPRRSSRGGPSAAEGRLPEDIAEWTIGTLVRHPQHGLGQVLSLERRATRTHVRVRFKDGATRAWALEFADLVRVDFDDVG